MHRKKLEDRVSMTNLKFRQWSFNAYLRPCTVSGDTLEVVLLVLNTVVEQPSINPGRYWVQVVINVLGRGLIRCLTNLLLTSL